MNQAFSYSLKMWLTTIVLATIIPILTLLLHARNLHDTISVLMLLFGSPIGAIMIGIVTIPSAIIFYIFSNYLSKKGKKFSSKIILSLLGLLLTCLSVSVFGDFQFTWGFLFIISPYLIAVLVSVWIYRLE